MTELSADERKKQERYRDARFKNYYDDIWKSVGKCVFCDLNEKYVFFEENGVVMTISLYAYIDGHFMIVPRRHVTSVKDLTQTEWETVRRFMYLAKKMIKEVHGVKGMQFVQKDGVGAQSTVEHIHFHCIPFDAPDLSVWNYRQLASTPLENVAQYKQARKKLIEADLKFQKKYANANALPVICDALIIRGSKVLLQERIEGMKFIPDTWGLPGGMIEDFSVPFETELAREVKEETGLIFQPEDFRLFLSRTGGVTRAKRSEHLKVTYPSAERFTWNTYILHDKSDTPVVPADDSKAAHWVELSEALDQPLNEGLKATLRQLQKELGL